MNFTNYFYFRKSGEEGRQKAQSLLENFTVQSAKTLGNSNKPRRNRARTGTSAGATRVVPGVNIF